MEFIFVASMDEVIAAAILLDEEQVGGLTATSDAADPAPVVPPAGTSLPYDQSVTDARGG